jgi:hypothetical protein
VLLAGVSGDCGTVHVLGGGVAPATQVSVTEFEYPFTGFAVPLKPGSWPENAINGELEIAS